MDKIRNKELDNFKKQLNIIRTTLDSLKNNIKKDTKKEKELIDKLDKNNIKYSNTFVIEYSLMNPGLEYDNLIKILEGYGMVKSNNPMQNHLFGIIDYKFYNSEFYLLNGLQFIDSIKDKYSLYLNLQLHFPEHYYKTYPHSFLLTANTKWTDIQKKPDNVFIARPINSDQGKDIVKVWNNDTLDKAKELLYINKYVNGISLTEYIINPLLYNGRKMHLRAYMAFTLINNEFKTYLLDVAKIFIAKNKYENEDWNNNDIHDTHFTNSGISMNFPDVINEDDKFTPKITKKEADIIIENIKECIYHISKIAVSNIYNYSNSKNSYEVFGIDVLVKDDLSVFIIEINAKFAGYKSATTIFERYFNWINEIVIKPCLFPNLETIKTSATTPIYSTKFRNY
jgi:hypothetical protein